ncbi:hypothetical protein HYV88_01705 [Candidatus Woesearchaeota archaeon]|nr:hypothetical protein [Candidatus Woesearchaeota archaeon]
MSDINITYETIYELLRKEKYETELQPLPQTFFNNVIEYLTEKQTILESQKAQDSIFSKESEKTGKQIQNVKRILKELYEKRENKIIQLALFSSRTNLSHEYKNMLPEEQEFFNSILRLLDSYRTGILDNILDLKLPTLSLPKDIKTENKETSKLIRFIHPVPKFVGEDLKIYGPFSEEDIANIPTRAAQILITKKRAYEIK